MEGNVPIEKPQFLGFRASFHGSKAVLAFNFRGFLVACLIYGKKTQPTGSQLHSLWTCALKSGFRSVNATPSSQIVLFKVTIWESIANIPHSHSSNQNNYGQNKYGYGKNHNDNSNSKVIFREFFPNIFSSNRSFPFISCEENLQPSAERALASSRKRCRCKMKSNKRFCGWSRRRMFSKGYLCGKHSSGTMVV